MKNFRSTTTYLAVRYLAVAAFIMTSLVACKKDGDPTPGDGVVGSWQISAIDVTPPPDGVGDYLAFLNALLGNDCLTKITFIFKSDGTMDGTSPKECQNIDPSDNVGIGEKSTWKVQDDKIIITSDGDATEYGLNVNRSTMNWSQSEVDPDDGKSYTTTIIFKRV